MYGGLFVTLTLIQKNYMVAQLTSCPSMIEIPRSYTLEGKKLYYGKMKFAKLGKLVV